ncbi:MAG: metal-sensitive transcriptional regulator [Candidatus Roizmanbacteria bacterium]|nr:MAG: metal-sensitive transcriptional regulator [Candidatus Roizmanbacteria bacterium]
MDLTQRINRIIGQLKGIQKMTQSKREVSDILQQVSAVKKAIDGLSKEIVINDISAHLPEKSSKKIMKMIERAINL